MSNQNKPDNHLLWAILSTLFCCLPLGIVSIIYAVKVDGLYKAGEYEDAQEAADKAKKYALYGAVCAGVIWVLYLVLVGAGVMAGAM